MGGERRPGSIARPRSDDRELLVDDPQPRIGHLGCRHHRHHPAAVRAAVVDELDQCDVAPVVATGRTVGMGADIVGANLGDRLRLDLRGPAQLRSRPAKMATTTAARLTLSITASPPTKPAPYTCSFHRPNARA